MAPESPCRLVVFLARDAPLGVVLRRGPSPWTQLSLWHTDTDTFVRGQWFKGRVYERRCDVSADGSLLLYFARKTTRRVLTSPGTDTWLALSRPPWFTALALWFLGGTYWSGGYFPDRQSVWLGGIPETPDQGNLPSWLRPTKQVPYIDRSSNWTEQTVYRNRLLRDGWTPRDGPEHALGVWERCQPHGRHGLVMTPHSDRDYTAHGGPHVVTYLLAAARERGVEPLGRATWADWDQQGRLILAQHGCLVHWESPGVLRELANFNHDTPDPQPAPPWATTWPDRPRGNRSTGV